MLKINIPIEKMDGIFTSGTRLMNSILYECNKLNRMSSSLFLMVFYGKMFNI